ncbi:MAG: hypothetical protein QOD41_2477 [Cryptosporangiaceae bacterium]|nr:hypothetical protein [Cryptosporangiaceae bacterium]
MSLGAVRRLVAAVVFAVVVAPGVAHADPPKVTCLAYEQAYGLTAKGALDEHDYCLADGKTGLQATHRVAPEGWWRGGSVLSAGNDLLVAGTPSVFYQVTPSGALYRYETGSTHTIKPGLRIGARFGDWRRIRSLFAPSPDALMGIDAHGRLLHWFYVTGSGHEQWIGPLVQGHGFTGREHLIGLDDHGAFGVDPASPHALVDWDRTHEIRRRGVLPASVDGVKVTGVEGLAPYVRGSGGRIVRLTRTGPGSASRWTAAALRSDRYAQVFAGGFEAPLVADPYEWQ